MYHVSMVINVYEAKTHLSKLLDRVAEGKNWCWARPANRLPG